MTIYNIIYILIITNYIQLKHAILKHFFTIIITTSLCILCEYIIQFKVAKHVSLKVFDIFQIHSKYNTQY